MDARLLGWAGIELRAGDFTLVIDPLRDPAALWAFLGKRANGVRLPEVVAAEPGASVALVTHLHRDHADAGALAGHARVLGPDSYGGSDLEEAGLAQARHELAQAGVEIEPLAAWDVREIDGWTITALPAADGLGDPQVSWLVERDGVRIVHAGDTLPHGWWWRIAGRAGGSVDAAFLPINAARVRFPHRRPAIASPAVMSGADAADAARVLQARRIVPIHHGAFDVPGLYESDPDALATLTAATGGQAVTTPGVGEWFALTS